MRTLPTPLLSTTMLGTQMKPVTVAKDLGLYVDYHLNFNEHITKTASDCMLKLMRVDMIKHLLDQKTLICLINAFNFCKLFYCSTVWSSMSKKNIRKLQLVQNYAWRIVVGSSVWRERLQFLQEFSWARLISSLFCSFVYLWWKGPQGELSNEVCMYVSYRYSLVPAAVPLEERILGFWTLVEALWQQHRLQLHQLCNSWAPFPHFFFSLLWFAHATLALLSFVLPKTLGMGHQD